MAGPRHDDLVQMAAVLDRAPAVQRLNAAAAVLQRAPNRTGLPDRLKQGVETLSGMSMDHVRVHYNSSKPAQLKAHAYAQGSEIHLAPGQEQHLPHEAWHVVQQAQGRVQPTMQMKSGASVNSDAGLEHEATVMGAKALGSAGQGAAGQVLQRAPIGGNGTIQLWPPASVDDAEQELNTLKAQLYGKGIQLQWTYMGRMKGTSLDKVKKMDLKTTLSNPGITATPGSSGLQPDEIIRLLKHMIELRTWRDRARLQEGGMGYAAVPSFAFMRTSPFQTTYGLNPYAPELHMKPFGYAPEGSSFEQLGGFGIVRGKTEEELDQQRKASKSYRKPPAKTKTLDTPPFDPTIYSGMSTMLNASRQSVWKQEKRGEIAHVGPFTGKKWPDQQSQLGRASAQEAVASYNHTAAHKLAMNVPYEWLHLFAFSMGGQDNRNPQDPRNFVVGTQHANYYHLIWETAAKTLAKTHNVLVTAEAEDPVSLEWRIYETIRYTITLVETHHGTFDRPQSFPVAKRSLEITIPCLASPQVHAKDAETLTDLILLELGVTTEKYRAATDEMLTKHQQGVSGPLSGFEEEYPDPMHMQDDDEQLHAGLVRSVQDHAEQHGVLDDFEVGHADGSNDNCSILSAFAAAGAPITIEKAIQYREQLFYFDDIPLEGPLDLMDEHVAKAILELVTDELGARQMVVIRPHGGHYALQPVAGDGEDRIFLYYSNGHFSPARPRG